MKPEIVGVERELLVTALGGGPGGESARSKLRAQLAHPAPKLIRALEGSAGEAIPCPFCGGTDLDKTEWVECNTCGAMGPGYDSKGGDNAASRWNRRTLLAQPASEAVGWQFFENGKWWNGSETIRSHRRNTEAAGYPVRDVYAHPPAPAGHGRGKV